MDDESYFLDCVTLVVDSVVVTVEGDFEDGSVAGDLLVRLVADGLMLSEGSILVDSDLTAALTVLDLETAF